MVRINEITNYLKKRTDNYEVFITDSSLLSLELSNNKVDFVSSGRNYGLGIRVFMDNRIGAAFTDDPAKYKECVDNAIRISKLNKPTPEFGSFPSKQKAKTIKTKIKKMVGLTREDILKYYQDYVQNLKEKNRDIDITSGGYKKVIQNKSIINSGGIDCQELQAYNTSSFGSIMLGEDISFSISYADRQPLEAEAANECADRILALKGKKDIKGGKIQLLMHQDALGPLLSDFINSACSAQNIINKSSLFVDKLNEKIADSSLTIEDNALNEKMLNARSFDDEGVASARTTIIKNGILQNFLHNVTTSNIMQVKNTGNASRTAFTRPEINTTNLILQPGKAKNLINEIDHGVYIKGLMGMHTINSHTGDFSLTVSEGHYVEKGEVKFPLKNAMISGNILRLLNNIELIGSEVKDVNNAGYAGTYLPEILFSEIQVIGNEN